MSKIINGREISQVIFNEIKTTITQLKQKTNQIPGLVTFLIGDNPASKSYVKLKIAKAKELGIREKQINLAKDVKETRLLELIEKYNQDDRYHGILVQLPLPPQISLPKVIQAIHPTKDVDGFHPINVGEMFTDFNPAGLYPCTPKAIVTILQTLKQNLTGKNVVILGRSNLVGKPTAVMCLEKKLINASVTVLHSASLDHRSFTKKADILIACLGKAKFIQREDVKKGAIVIDVGVNKIGENPKNKKAILSGDVDFDSVKEKAKLITPVPGGVGPMTIAMLMENVLIAFQKSLAS